MPPSLTAVAFSVQEAPLGAAVRGIAAGIVLQLCLGAPFLVTYPKAYVARAFELSRVFTFKWSVNWQFIPEHWFTSRQLAIVLLLLHLRLLWTFCRYRWCVTWAPSTESVHLPSVWHIACH